ncbi:hypothetical protein [Conexibacter woesei]|uniref:Uncharacterized protein n=1 Tax=Conexibacter woesei (strain DSM 14684 / CCUG 47730 / CIP 108061 / JCM 11494 / NBRC 100937 / ID131577) TaxID=469383 RepID=D3F6D5_CONWI|nr:hypothetical protein [Conexibacter woesei]ADB50702.1 hypothetical protein Cwoe_2277 [Conexibacter woesei DSM 14684]
MPKVVQLKPENGEAYLPPAFFVEFSKEEFVEFLANPTVVMGKVGHPVGNLTVSVKDHVWDAGKREWITEKTDAVILDLPEARSWQWLCGIQDEMCICERVIML